MENYGFLRSNPFLDDISVYGSSSDGSEDFWSTPPSSAAAGQPMVPPPPQFPPVPPPQPARYPVITLPPFWADKPLTWFGMVEARFRLYGITDDQYKYDLQTNSLTGESSSLAVDIIESPPLSYPYTTLKQRLLSAHQMTEYQKISQLLKMGPLGGRRPSELLAAMLELCPRGEEKNVFFTHLFLERLPAELRIMLGEDDRQDPRSLADKADQLWDLHGGKSHQIAAVAADAQELDPLSVAAISTQHKGKGGQKGRVKNRGTAAGAAGALPPAAATPRNAPSDLAQLQAGLCYYHWTYGDKASKCKTPCTWGN